MSTKDYTIFVLIIVSSMLASFYSGFFWKNLINKNPKNNLESRTSSNLFKPTFIDEALLIAKDNPHITLKITAFRKYKSINTYSYTLKAHYFDGNKWQREIATGEYQDIYNIPSSSFLPKWEINYDPSYMLRQSAFGETKFADTIIKFNLPSLNNEMPVRSSPKYTKFMSEGEGELVINEKVYPSKVLYSRVYSFDSPESLIYTDDPSGIETEWLAFWEDNGNFYSIDETIIDNKITKNSYKAHSMAIEKDKDDKIQFSFDMDLKKDYSKNYSVNIKENINKFLDIKKINNIVNDVDESTKWYVGQVVARNRSGFGFFEQISQ